MATRYEEPDVAGECECGAEVYCRVTYQIDPGERASLHCPGYGPGIEAIEVEANDEHCSECGKSTEAAADRLFEELDKDSHRAWELLNGDRIYEDARPYDY